MCWHCYLDWVTWDRLYAYACRQFQVCWLKSEAFIWHVSLLSSLSNHCFVLKTSPWFHPKPLQCSSVLAANRVCSCIMSSLLLSLNRRKSDKIFVFSRINPLAASACFLTTWSVFLFCQLFGGLNRKKYSLKAWQMVNKARTEYLLVLVIQKNLWCKCLKASTLSD